MKITSFRLDLLEVPLRTPFKTALRTVAAVHDVVVTIVTDSGHSGHGSAAPTAAITGETHGSIIAAIRGYIAPSLTGREVADFNETTEAVQRALQGNHSAKAAVDIALHVLFGQLQGVPLFRVLGGSPRVLATDITISVDEVDKMVADALEAVGRGFAALKVKIGKHFPTDVDRIKAIHAAVGGRALLRLDANQGWTPKQAVRAMRELERAGVQLDLLEQPVAARDIDGLKFVTDRVQVPVMADESVFSSLDAIEIIRRRAADIINIKLMKAGGIGNALRIADIAAAHGVECMIGCMLESSIGIAAAAHVALARPGVVTRVDLDGPALCLRDPVTSGVSFDGPRITVSDAPGLGFTAIDGLRAVPE